MLKTQFDKITKWQDETFEKATAFSMIQHLKKEVDELEQAVLLDDDRTDDKLLELSDCLILLYGIARKLGMEYKEVTRAVARKHSINEDRVWNNADRNGIVEHIEMDEVETERLLEQACDLINKAIDNRFEHALKFGRRHTEEKRFGRKIKKVEYVTVRDELLGCDQTLVVKIDGKKARGHLLEYYYTPYDIDLGL